MPRTSHRPEINFLRMLSFTAEPGWIAFDALSSATIISCQAPVCAWQVGLDHHYYDVRTETSSTFKQDLSCNYNQNNPDTIATLLGQTI